MKALIACAAGTTELTGAPTQIVLIPRGKVSSQKGDFIVDEQSFAAMKAEFNRRGNDVVIDYEHQTLGDGQAPAAGWIKALALTDQGVEGTVEWTAKAQEYLINKEYRYLSPVVLARKSDGRAIVLHSAALTNAPAIDHMKAIVNSIDVSVYIDPEKGNDNMNELLKKLITLLKLNENATEDQVLEALGAAIAPSTDPQTELVANKTILDLLGCSAEAKTEDVSAAIMALKNTSSTVSKADFLALKAQLDQRDADEAVLTAMKAGKITPAQKEWATEYALKDRAGFDAFVLKAPQVIPLDKLDLDSPLKPRTAALDDTTMKICKMAGVTEEDVKKYGGAE